MDLRQSDHVAAYYDKVGEFAARHAAPELLDRVWESGTLYNPAIHKALAAEGWIGANWPTSVGGRGLSAAEFGALWEAMLYHRLPVDVLQVTEMAAHAIIHAGNPAQHGRILPGVLAGETLIALGYTEPDAGSDVAAVRTSAVSRGDDWVINGAKIFTTGAHVADYVFLLVRTDASVAKHRGLTLFLVPTTHPGVSMQPINTFGGERTNATFYDDVVVPSDAVVGGVNDGWSVLNTALGFERSVIGSMVGYARRHLDDLCAALGVSRRRGDPVVKAHLAKINAKIELGRVLAHQVYERLAAGLPLIVEAAMTKLLVTEALKDAAHLALDLVGPESLIRGHGDGALVNGSLEHWFRHAQVVTIYGGSNEIQRNIIAQRRLGLPRS